ncbi:MAG: hypothetical protein ISP97_08400 [Luminiphilus sp.]|nr:hypothetical protein [Luminiphilus sp.]
MRGYPRLVLLLLLFCSAVTARPVSYTGGWTIIEESDRQASSALVHYTPAPSWSIGLRTEVNRDNDYAIYSVHPTFLAKRWFGKDYQGNLYFHGGIGVASGIDGNPLSNETAVYGGIMADWETRSLFAGYRSRYLDAGPFGDQFMHAARVGYAPYEGDSGDLHTWLMLEIDHRPEEEVPITATPLVRLFKGPLLLEVGYNLTVNQPLLNFTYRF